MKPVEACIGYVHRGEGSGRMVALGRMPDSAPPPYTVVTDSRLFASDPAANQLALAVVICLAFWAAYRLYVLASRA